MTVSSVFQYLYIKIRSPCRRDKLPNQDLCLNKYDGMLSSVSFVCSVLLFDEVTFRRNGSLDEVSFDKVSHTGTKG